MNKLALSTVIATVMTVTYARPMLTMTPELLARTGGYYNVPDSMKGEVCVANCASRADQAWLSEIAEYLRSETDLNVTCTNDCTFTWPKPKLIGDFTLFVVDDKAMPSVLVASEDKWAMVNVAQLKDERTQFFAMRVKKMLVRVFALLCGGAASNYQGGLSGPLVSVKELDKLMHYRLQADVKERLLKYLRAFSITPQITTTYLAACTHGVAPAPTNDVQKAIWDKVHAMPTEPLKIKPEEKKTER